MTGKFLGIFNNELYVAEYTDVSLTVLENIAAYNPKNQFSKEAKELAKRYGIKSLKTALSKRQLQLCSPLEGLVSIVVNEKIKEKLG